MILGLGGWGGGVEVITLGGGKKEFAAIQCKAHREIVNNCQK